MCTNFHRSAYEIFRLFDRYHPKSVKEVYKELGESKVEITLGATASIRDFIQAVCTERDLEKQGEGYILTESGVCERERLSSLVNASS